MTGCPQGEAHSLNSRTGRKGSRLRKVTTHTRMKSNRPILAAVVAALPLLALAQDKKPDGAAAVADAPVSMCIGCHSIPGYQASFPQVYRVPKIGGQSQQYIEAALKEYRDGSRSHPTMTGIAKGLSDPQIAAVAAYYAGRGK